jgi:dihydroorotase
MTAIHDLLIRGGTLIDPAQGINGRRDVAFRDGVVSGVAERLPESDAREVLDAAPSSRRA